MKKLRIPTPWLIALLLVFFMAVSFILRTVPPYQTLVQPDWIKFSSIDAYYQMRVVDNLVANFPHLTSFDPYIAFPTGGGYDHIHFFNWLLALIIWVIGLGSPSPHLVDMAGVFYPAILAALTVLPVYFIGKALINRGAGLVAAGLMAVFPGEYLGRSILGFTDQHVAEVLLTTTAAMFLILAIKTASRRELSWRHVRALDWAVIRRPLVYTVLAGLFLGLYLVTWGGALLFIFIITCFAIIQAVINHLRGRPVAVFSGIISLSFLVAALVFIPLAPSFTVTLPLYLAFLAPLFMAGVSVLLNRTSLPRYAFPVILIVGAVVAVFVLRTVSPTTFQWMVTQLKVFMPSGAGATTTMEMQPFLSPQGSFSTTTAWSTFTTSIFLAPWWVIPGFGFAAALGLFWHRISGNNSSVPVLVAFAVSAVVAVIFTAVEIGQLYQVEFNEAFFLSPWWLVFAVALLFTILGWYNVQKTDSGSWLATFIISLIIVIVTLLVFAFSAVAQDMTPVSPVAISFAVLLGLYIKNREHREETVLFLIWTVVMCTLMLIQRRFAYYFVINVALLSGYLVWHLFRLAGSEKVRLPGETEAAPAAARPAKKGARRPRVDHANTYNWISVGLALVIVILFVFLPNFQRSKVIAANPQYAPTDAWQASLEWLRDNSPEPLGDAEAYYRYYDENVRDTYVYPESAYGVTAWWDYGYWITRIAHRIPTVNPSQDAVYQRKVAELFLSRDNAQTAGMMADIGSRYIVADIATATEKFWAVSVWGGESTYDGINLYVFQDTDQPTIKLGYEEAFFTPLFKRLYFLDGKAAEPRDVTVVAYTEITDSSGLAYRLVNSTQSFPTYLEALNYRDQKRANPGNTQTRYELVSFDPTISPVPLEAVAGFELVYRSGQTVDTYTWQGQFRLTIPTAVPEIKIFAYGG